MFRTGWPHRIAHFCNEDLLAYLDGETAPKKAKDIDEHLKSCWGCRARLHEIEQSVTEFVIRRAEVVNSLGAAPPRGWREFEIRLEELANRSKKPPLALRCSAWLGKHFTFRRALELVSAALAVAAVCLWLVTPPPKASAKEVLAHAADAEAKMIARVPNPVVYQKLRLRRTAPRTKLEEATLEVWSDKAEARLGQRGEDLLWRELDNVLETNHVPRPVVSARAFCSWRSAIQLKHESVKSMNSPSGVPALSVKATVSGPYRENQIVEGELQVRASDWLPLNQIWRVQGQDGMREYELQPIEQSVLARADVNPSIQGGLPPYVERALVPLPPPPALQPEISSPLLSLNSADSDTVEIEARYALHRRGDCLAGLIQVQREARGKIVVRGLVETAQQKEELTAALPHSPLLTLDVKTLDDFSETTAAPARQWESESRAQVRGQEIPAADLLRPRLAEMYGAKNVPQRMAALANEAVSLSRTMRMDAWALRRLAERYGAGGAVPAGSARWMLEAMMREHVLRLRAETARSLAALDPLFQAPGKNSAPSGRAQVATSSWSECLDLADRVEEIDTLIQELFTASGRTPQPVAPAIQNLETAFARLDTDFQKVEARLALATSGEKP